MFGKISSNCINNSKSHLENMTSLDSLPVRGPDDPLDSAKFYKANVNGLDDSA